MVKAVRTVHFDNRDANQIKDNEAVRYAVQESVPRFLHRSTSDAVYEVVHEALYDALYWPVYRSADWAVTGPWRGSELK